MLPHGTLFELPGTQGGVDYEPNSARCPRLTSIQAAAEGTAVDAGFKNTQADRRSFRIRDRIVTEAEGAAVETAVEAETEIETEVKTKGTE